VAGPRGAISVGTLTFLAGAIAAAQIELQTLFTLFSAISQQALFLSDLLVFLRVRPPGSSRRRILGRYHARSSAASCLKMSPSGTATARRSSITST
jgi:hypothetical protein